MKISYRDLNSGFLFAFVLLSGTLSLFYGLRLIELIIPFLAIILIAINKNIIPFGGITKLTILFSFLVLTFGFFQFSYNSLFAIRLVNSVFACGIMFYFSSSLKHFKLMPEYFLIIASVFYILGIYAYFWEYMYIFSVLLAPLFFLKKYLFGFIDIIMLMLIGQRTAILNILFIIYFSFLSNIKLNILRTAPIFLIIILGLYAFFNLDSRAINVYRDLDFSEILAAISAAIELASYYSYDEFVHGEGRAVLVEGGDLSLHLRFRKWGHALASSDLYSIFFGLGPGYFGKAADSGVIRLFFEYGLFVFITFTWLILKILKNSNALQRLIIGIFIISNIFLDVLYSPMLMGFTGMILGLSRSINEDKN